MITTAIDVARKAGRLAYHHFLQQPRVAYKPDKSPVTLADLEAEKLIRKIILAKFPNHGIIGEEFGSTNPDAKFCWVIDPIDGTKYFTKQTPFWSTLISVLENGKPIIGISFFPATGEFFVAKLGKGTYLNGKKVKVSRTQVLQNSFVAYGAITHFEAVKKVGELVAICKNAKSVTGAGWSMGHNLLLKGAAEVVLETGRIYDFAAVAILVEEAGGKFTDFSGQFSLTSGTACATNGLVHDEVLKLLNRT